MGLRPRLVLKTLMGGILMGYDPSFWKVLMGRIVMGLPANFDI